MSVEEGFALGATEAELFDDANLAAMCQACNLGLGALSVSPRTYAVMLWLVRAEMQRAHTAVEAIERGVHPAR